MTRDLVGALSSCLAVGIVVGWWARGQWDVVSRLFWRDGGSSSRTPNVLQFPPTPKKLDAAKLAQLADENQK